VKKFIVATIIFMIAFAVLHLTHMPISANDYQDGEKAFISYQIGNEPVVKIKKNFFTKTMYAYQNGVYTILKNKDGSIKKAK